MKIFIPTAFARAGGWLARARGARAAMTLLLLLVTTTTARADIAGFVDLVQAYPGSIEVSGWTYETGNENTIGVHVQIWDTSGQTLIKTVGFTANIHRDDVGDKGFHGFVPIDNAGTYMVKVAAMGVSSSRYLNGSTPTASGAFIDTFYSTPSAPWTISYDANGGTGAPAPQANCWAVPSTLSTVQPTRPGYTFTGWNTAVDGSGDAWASGYTYNYFWYQSNVTLYAQWTPNTYTVYFDKYAADATGTMSTQTFTYDVPQALIPNAFSRTGYIFEEWREHAGLRYYSNCQVVSNLTTTDRFDLEAMWKAITYTVRFHKNHDDATGTMGDQSFIYDIREPLKPNAFSRPGYDIAGWSTTPDGPVVYTNTQPVSNLANVQGAVVNLYAQWTELYTISYDLAGGSVAKRNPTTYTVLSNAITLINPTKAGCEFTGWTGTGLAGPTMTVTIPAGSTGNRSYTATWLSRYNAYNTTTGKFEVRVASNPIHVTSSTTTMGAAGTETWYVVNSNVTIGSRIAAKGTVHLILCDGTTLAANGGISVTGGNALYIYTQGSGTGCLTATATDGAGIGGTSYSSVGNITIHGGTITATGGAWAAGIGGGMYSSGGSITIYGGNVEGIGWRTNGGDAVGIGRGSSGAAVAILADGLRLQYYNWNYWYDSTYSQRGSRLGYDHVRFFPCTEHSYSDGRCTDCGKCEWYTVTYNGNGSTGGSVPTDNTHYATDGTGTVTVLGNTGNLERTGYIFGGWNTQADGNGTNYAPGATFAISTPVTLYATWMALIGSIDYVYSHNGSISFGGWAYEVANPNTPIPVQVQIWSGENFIKTVEFMANNPREDLGYNCGFTGVIPLDEGTYKVKIMAVGTTSVYLGSDLYRQVGTPWYISYDANGGTGAPEPQTNHWAVPSTLSTVQPTRPGYTFTGWNTEPDGSGIPYPSGYTDIFYVWMSDRTLYAQWSASLLTLANNADNSEAIGLASGDGMYYDVTLAGRTLYKDGDWNTLCLPFDVTIAGSVLDGADVRALDNANLTGGVLTLNFTNQGDVTTIKAGKPYIIRWTKAEGYVDDDEHNLVNPVFRNVTVKSDMNDFESTDHKVQFCGTYDHISWNTEDRSILFLGEKNQLHWPDADASLGACRAYFQLTEGTNGVREFKLSFGDGTQTIIGHTEITDITERADAWYTVNGVKLSGKPRVRGIYVKNGKKVVVK